MNADERQNFIQQLLPAWQAFGLACAKRPLAWKEIQRAAHDLAAVLRLWRARGVQPADVFGGKEDAAWRATLALAWGLVGLLGNNCPDPKTEDVQEDLKALAELLGTPPAE